MSDTQELLRAGIEAAKAGERERARELLTQVVDQDEYNLAAWLWLSGVVAEAEEREICLENVLTIDPGNEAARKGLERLRRQRLEGWLQGGVAAAKAGRRQEAQALLGRYVEQQPDNPAAWIWLSSVVEDLAERQRYLENALAIDPQNQAAQRGLELIRAQRPDLTSLSEPPPASEAAAESPLVARARMPISPAAAILREQFMAQLPPEEEVEPAPVASPVWDDLENEYGCPYCATPTDAEDRRCPSCGGDLWARFRVREKRSALLWVVIAFQLFSTTQFLAAPMLLVVSLSMMVGLHFGQNVPMTDLLNAYLGVGNALSPQIVDYAFSLLPRTALFLSALPALFSLGVLVGLYLRWRPIYYLFLVDAVLELLVLVASMIVTRNLVFGSVGIGLALLRLFLVFQLEDDFRWDRRRILLRPDRGLTSGAAFLIAGEEYVRRGMWAMAALHMRQAAALLPTGIGSRLALALACMHMKRYDMAEQALEEARQIQPDRPKLQELAALLAEQRAAMS